jgi:TPR repeat protein
MKRFFCATLSTLALGFNLGVPSVASAADVDVDELGVWTRLDMLDNVCDFKSLSSRAADDDVIERVERVVKLVPSRILSTCDFTKPSWTRFTVQELKGYRTRWLLDRVLLLDGIERLQAAAARKDPEDARAQALLGYAKREGRGIEKDVDGAYKLLSSACEAGDPTGCLEETFSVYWGRGTPQDHALSILQFKDLCDQSLGTACDRLGFIYSRGEGEAVKDPALANAYFDEACANDSGNGCMNMGNSYKNGFGRLVDQEKASDAYGKACDRGESYACALNWDLTLASREGPNPLNIGVAIWALEKGCNLGSGASCFKIGDIVNKGRHSLERNPEFAYRYMARACKLGQSNGCYNQGSWLISGRGVKADSRKAIEVLRPLCERETPDYQACNNAGSAAYRGIGMDGPDYQLAADFYRKACYFSGMPAACSSMIDMLEDGETRPLQPNELDVLRAKMAE